LSHSLLVWYTITYSPKKLKILCSWKNHRMRPTWHSINKLSIYEKLSMIYLNRWSYWFLNCNRGTKPTDASSPAKTTTCKFTYFSQLAFTMPPKIWNFTDSKNACTQTPISLSKGILSWKSGYLVVCNDTSRREIGVV
jgi:hypothetical protein